MQPQWVYDSFNAGILLPVQEYFVGAELPAHLSPFEETYNPDYTPPEMLKLMALKGQVNLAKADDANVIDMALISDSSDEGEDEEEEEEDKEEKEEYKEEETSMETEESIPVPKKEKKKADNILSGMRVRPSKPYKRDKTLEQAIANKEDLKLRESFIHRRQKRLYRKIKGFEEQKKKVTKSLKDKRIHYETEKLQKKKAALKAAKKAEVIC